ncbi:alanine-glyoxylate transaminase/serine-glyoxylate transaminase/serine-pyruvate transaminase [Tenacibaculum skagerrakense]|uniref:Alanine-glyoxylate transaminase/serine-glyoxylate transaminase/serine-pyruvate transaminase n=1 Tax=Tenacibaculum skagerrakense TaxID=186571 RepID=A0A4R2NMY0_9FLAO|nr:alanine--glyoxylate aminotransferase family protein [Tenacibaculum skagerrakense]TCP22882.1 alanine-glyoxylate transaminase/serine-glyoxylate transaminase/serine-pyruvate transaminase [Tenacibaculum skagerrakense]
MKNRKLLMIPGPIEVDPSVLRAIGEVTTSHVAPNFIECFGNSIELMRKIWQAPYGQPFIIAGSGTLAMDMAVCNLIEPEENALVISTGYFGERYKNILTTYGAKVTVLQAEIGEIVPLEEVEKELSSKDYKLVTITHVDTSTGVLNDPQPIAEIAQKYNTLTILDGVCATAGEISKQEEWGIDVVLTGSQKAIGVPPGLALFVVSEKAMNVWKNRKNPVQNYYGSFTNWLPIMKAYEERKPSYFGTPPVNLIRALEVSLNLINNEGIENRIATHLVYAKAFRKAIQKIGLELVPKKEDEAANTMSAIYYPEGIDGNQFIKGISEYGVILAGGLHSEIKTKYFRVGHMGAITKSDIVVTLSAIEFALAKQKYKLTIGESIGTFLENL